MTEDEGLRERKKRETRAAISLAAIRLCARSGWDDVTIADIADAANVSERTFRNYFANKAEAVAATHLERVLRTVDDLRGRPADEPIWDAVTAAVSAQYDAPPAAGPGEADEWAAGVRRVLAEPALAGELLKANAIAQDELAAAIAERAGMDRTADLYPRLVAAVVTAATGAVVGHWLLNGPTESVAPRLHAVLGQLRAGVEEAA